MTIKEIKEEIKLLNIEKDNAEQELKEAQEKLWDKNHKLVALRQELTAKELQKHTIKEGEILCVKEETFNYHVQPYTIYYLHKQTTYGFDCTVYKYRIDDGDKSFRVDAGKLYNKEIIELCKSGNTTRITPNQFMEYMQKFIHLEIDY